MKKMRRVLTICLLVLTIVCMLASFACAIRPVCPGHRPVAVITGKIRPHYMYPLSASTMKNPWDKPWLETEEAEIPEVEAPVVDEPYVSPDTGASGVWTAMAAVSCAGLAVLVVTSKKREEA